MPLLHTASAIKGYCNYQENTTGVSQQRLDEVLVWIIGNPIDMDKIQIRADSGEKSED